MANDEHRQVFDDKLSVLLIIIGSVALIVTIYHCVSFWCYSWWQITLFNPIGRVLRRGSVHGRGDQETRSSIENSVAHLIPTHTYKKGLDLEGQDITCAVCLCEFQEGEELRTLPECMHKFHMGCIDMWLYSHSNCPICRANATPSIELLQISSDSGDHLNNPHPTIRIDVGSLFVHTRLI